MSSAAHSDGAASDSSAAWQWLARPRTGWALLLAVLGVYALAFCVYYPSTPTNYDEAMYLRQAQLLADGRSYVMKIDPRSGAEVAHYPSTYALGPALVMAPFVRAFGWRGAYAAPLLGLLLGSLFTALWLRGEGHSPLYALPILGFVPSLVMARVAMSDVPSLAVVALGLWLFWRGQDRGAGCWLASGLVAGVSLIFRASNVLPFIPFYAGALLRRERHVWALVVGGLVGVSSRFVSNAWAFGDPLFERDVYRFEPATLGERLPLYLLGLLVMVPGGLLAAAAYRGRRRPELFASIYLFFFFYLFQSYSTDWSAGAKRLVLALRYFIPLLPVLCFALADVAPRAWQALRARWPSPAWPSLAAAAVAVWIAGLASASVGVHWFLDRFSQGQAALGRELNQRVADDAVLVTNSGVTRKFYREVERRFVEVEYVETTPREVSELVRRWGGVTIALVDRTDSELWREMQRGFDAFIAAVEPAPILVFEGQMTPAELLRVWRVGADGAPTTADASPP